MIKVFYIEDNNGQYVSADGSKRWTRLTGQALYDFLQTERGKKTYFFVDTDDNGVAIGVEITDKEQQIAFETDKRRRRYVSESQKESGYIMVSFDYVETEDGTSTGDEVIPNDDDSIENDVLRQFDLETLRRALDIYTEFHEKIDVCLQSLSRCFNAVLPKIFSNIFILQYLLG